MIDIEKIIEEERKKYEIFIENKMEYLMENINSIESALFLRMIDFNEMVYFFSYDIELETLNEKFSKYNTEKFRKLTEYRDSDEQIKAILDILARVHNHALTQLNMFDQTKKEKAILKTCVRNVLELDAKFTEKMNDNILQKTKVKKIESNPNIRKK